MKAMCEFRGPQVGGAISKNGPKWAKRVKMDLKSCATYNQSQKLAKPRGLIPFLLDSLIPKDDFDLIYRGPT